MGARINIDKLIGEKFGMLIINRAYREGKYIMCDCICDCGGGKDHIRYSALKDGSTKSCGCLQKEMAKNNLLKYDLDKIVGEEYDRLTVINAYREGKKSLIYCDCKCKCGNLAKHVQYSSLKNGSTKSCGCIHNELSAKRLSLQRKKYNQYKEQDDYMVGICSDGTEFIFDKDDYEKISSFCWYKNQYGYLAAYNPKEKNVILFHRYIMNCPDGYEVDHIYHNLLDNRKSQLRICKPQENALNKLTPLSNTSGHKNVAKTKYGTWSVCIKKKWIGTFDTYEEACRVEEEKEKEMYGEFSVYSN